jgi:hypothetical protein
MLQKREQALKCGSNEEEKNAQRCDSRDVPRCIAVAPVKGIIFVARNGHFNCHRTQMKHNYYHHLLMHEVTLFFTISA